MEEECSKCMRTSSQVRLLDAIDNNEVVKICEECALIEDIPIIRRPSSFQLKASEKPQTVYQRLAKLTGVKSTQETQKVQEVMKKITKAKPKDISQLSIKQRQALATQANIPIDLVDNFHWHIQMARRKKKISQKQLAEALGEDEEIIKMIESANLPDDAARITKKIEQYLNLKLTKTEFEAEQTRLEQVRQPARVLSFDPETLRTLTISDLITMKKQQLTQAKTEEKEPTSKPTSQSTAEDILGDDIDIIDEE